MTPSLFITATDTGVGKTFVGCLLAEVLRESGKSVGVLKPFSAGDLKDAQALHRAAASPGEAKAATLLYCRRPLAPAAQLGLGRRGKRTVLRTFAKSVAALRGLQREKDNVLVEGVGGLLAPLGGPFFVLDLLKRLDLPVWIVARAGLGTLNHTLLTVEALKRGGVRPRRILLNNGSARDMSEGSNVRLIKGLTKLPVTSIPRASSFAQRGEAKRRLWRAFRADFYR